jgi:hypothetical protein
MMANRDQPSIQMVDVDKLHFDRQNPRLAEFGISDATSEGEILKILWESMDVRELVQSMAASGFFPHEALIVSKEDGTNIVIEGNRRLAALKVILGSYEDESVDWEIPEIPQDIKQSLLSVPVTFSTRSESWRFLGFKHVNGAAKWTSFAKAKYIALVHREYGQTLPDIARQIGDGFGTVKKLFHGLMVLEQADSSGVYEIENRFNNRLAFSHLYTGLGYEGFRDYLGLAEDSGESIEPVPMDKLEHLGEVCTWLYGDKSANRPPAIKSQNPNLRQLNGILKSREAIQALRDSNDIEQAFEFTRPSEAIFEESLLRAKRELHKAKSHLANGYDKSEGLLRAAGSIAELADSIYEEMDRLRTPKPKRERLKE